MTTWFPGFADLAQLAGVEPSALRSAPSYIEAGDREDEMTNEVHWMLLMRRAFGITDHINDENAVDALAWKCLDLYEEEEGEIGPRLDPNQEPTPEDAAVLVRTIAKMAGGGELDRALVRMTSRKHNPQDVFGEVISQSGLENASFVEFVVQHVLDFAQAHPYQATDGTYFTL
jgi:hypothetical protein